MDDDERRGEPGGRNAKSFGNSLGDVKNGCAACCCGPRWWQRRPGSRFTCIASADSGVCDIFRAPLPPTHTTEKGSRLAEVAEAY